MFNQHPPPIGTRPRRTPATGYGELAPQGPLTPPVGNYAYRGPSRGYVHQIGNAPRIDPLSGETTAQSNAHNYLNPTQDGANWNAMFDHRVGDPSHHTNVPAPQVGPQLPQTDNQQFDNVFTANGQKPRGVAAPSPATPAAPTAAPQVNWMDYAPVAHARDAVNPSTTSTAAVTPSAQPATATPPTTLSPAAPQPLNLSPVKNNYGTNVPMHTWQQSITAKYPAIGTPGSPENQSFLSEFAKHNDPEQAMKTADEIMRGQTAAGEPMPGMVPKNQQPTNQVDPYA